MGKIKNYIFLHLALLFYSLGGIFSKTAIGKAFLSPAFLFFYCLVLLILFVYAILWQQILKKMPLTTAFANKSIIMVWGMVWGNIFFQEKITLTMILGAVIIFLGICLVVTDHE